MTYLTRHGDHHYLWVSFEKCCQGPAGLNRIGYDGDGRPFSW
ncbi:hypothetical protein Aph02nite_00570 [Actinoplanes philippinensis]|nr:arabinan endo-1,5-alpha-L-arabinosidase [Actinoplanes philippinensis]GIE74107.1 hypothetical protein Aph02nite_00570 [Actinoplanes philippinensis]